jgi:hypothetical protein
MFLFHVRISELERENNSAIEVIQVIDSVSMSLKNRLEEEFLPLKVKQGLKTLVENRSEQKCGESMRSSVTSEIYISAFVVFSDNKRKWWYLLCFITRSRHKFGAETREVVNFGFVCW